MTNMTKILIFLGLILGSGLNASAATNAHDLAKHSMFNAIKISPKGDFLAATYPYKNHKRLAIINKSNQKVVCNFFFGEEESVMEFWWANEERVVMTISTQSGQYATPFLTGELFSGNADCSSKIQLFGVRNKDYSGAQVESLLMDERNNILISSNLEKKQYSNLYKVNIYTGKRQLIEKAKFENASIFLDNNDQWRVSQSMKTERKGLLKSEGAGEIITYIRESNVDQNAWKALSLSNMVRTSSTGSSNVIGFSADNQFIFTSDNIEKSTLGIYRIKLSTGERELMYRNDIVDAQPFINVYTSETGKRIKEVVGAIIHNGRPEVIFFDENSELAKEYRGLQRAFPNDYLHITSKTADNKSWVIESYSDVNPGKFYLYDRETKKVSFLTASRPWIDEQKMSHKTPINFVTRDGLTIHGYLTIPLGAKAENLPLIIHPHGGPHGPRDYWFFDDEVQVYASAGYSVLQVNFRGSGGYGREFEDSGYGQWGGAMQDDLTDATLWAIKEGFANKDKICISGSSYGGYAALMGVVKEPELYKCAIGYVGVYDLPLMFNKGNVAERLGWGKRYMEQAFGGSEETMKKHSPAYNASKIKAGVFIVHGGRDEQAHYENAHVMRDALVKTGNEPKWLWKKTEGHGFYNEENRKELYTEMLDFLKKYLN
ncbi:alpha/beta hydrolase family protein [Shewanella hafniensis]|uniref:alpha/beta hydrolase family protein n=2 Tax=Shewanella hafniensis TaxID=365590 RepID=UPI00200D6ECD|nr:prolyl oligopeptidase family serine peptidase [Shewanella hafniensis]MCL1134906.1 prolyl oligopeptidase family serine peptidase [Shewanella hafniensis]